jgi:reverse gyrase
MNPIYKFNNGRGATICHLCRTIITTGKMTNDLYCDRCLSERVKTEEEFNAIHRLKQNKYLIDERGQWSTPENDEAWKKFLEQMDKEVHFNCGDLNK